MGRIKPLKFQSAILLYSFVLIGVFLLVTVILFASITIRVTGHMQGYYIPIEGTQVTGQNLNIPLSELQESIVTAEELNTLFTTQYIQLITYALLISLSISLLLSFAFACLLNRRIVKPIAAAVNSLKDIKEKQADSITVFPKEFAEIEATFLEAKAEIAQLYTDFEHLGSYISHEQKNALAVLRAMIQNEYAAIGEQAVTQIDRMVKNMDDILTLSTNVAKLEKVDLPLICGTVVDEYRKVFAGISFDFDEEAALYIAGHELLIYRAVCNLVDNAVKYGMNKPISVYVGIQKNCPYVSVCDKGIGISAEQQCKIFKNGYRIGNRKKDGYGIGLSLVRHAAELCGGFVWIESKENIGSTFKMAFPPFTLD